MSNASRAARVVLLAPDDLARVLRLQRSATANLPAGFFRAKPERDLHTYLDGTAGAAFGVVQHGELLASALLRIPNEEHPNQGRIFPQVPNQDWPFSASWLENAMVHPAARGRGYQRLLLNARAAHAASAGMRWICAGVHLKNSVSWTNLLANGMLIAGIRLDLGYPIIGLLAALNARTLPTNSIDQLRVTAYDHTQHHAALQSGYVGARLGPDGSVVYQRLIDTCARAAE